MENPIKMGCFGGTPIFGNTHKFASCDSLKMDQRLQVGGFCQSAERDMSDIYIYACIQSRYIYIYTWNSHGGIYKNLHLTSISRINSMKFYGYVQKIDCKGSILSINSVG